MNCFKAYIFDMDNTLYDYSYCHRNGINAVVQYLKDNYYGDYGGSDFEDYSRRLKNIQINSGNEACRTSIHNKLLYFQELAMDNVNIKNIAQVSLEMYDAYLEGFLSDCRPFPWVESYLRDLKWSGAFLGICTNQTSHMQLNILSKLGFSELFDVVITSELVGVEKPKESIYHEVFRHLLSKNCMLKQESVCFVGDNYEHDFRGPKACGYEAMNYYSLIEGVTNEYCGRKIWS